MYRRIVSSTSSFFPHNDDFIIPSTVEEIFMDYLGRRLGFLRAFFRDVNIFYSDCDPAKGNMCLYAHPNGSWELIVPNVNMKRPLKLPEPALGINVFRDGMRRDDWLGLVAIHSDYWLLSIVSLSSARLSPDKRNCLFDMINDLPTLNEEVKKYHPKEASMHPGSK